MINVNEEKPDPSPPSCDHPSVFGVCVELKKDDDKVEEASDMGSVNQDSTVLTEREEPGVPKHGKIANNKSVLT